MMEYASSQEYPPIQPVQETNEWTYTMRRTMQEIVPGLYLGPYSVATKSKLDVLLHNGITHVVCVRQDIEAHIIKPHFEDRFKYLVLNIADTTTENIIKHFPVVCLFIDEAISSGGKCLVHGNAGISRSAALVMAYIMQKYGLCSRNAFFIVQQRRFCINPNDGFMAQLSEFEPIYRAQRTRFNGQCSTENNRNKRRIEDLEEPVTESEGIDGGTVAGAEACVVNTGTAVAYNGNGIIVAATGARERQQHRGVGVVSSSIVSSTSSGSCEPGSKLSSCNYVVKKAILDATGATIFPPHEAMDQEISS